MKSESSNPKKKAGAARRPSRPAGRAKYSPETKAAVLAALLAGQASHAIARQYKLPEGTIKGWKSKMEHGESPVTTTPAQKEDVGQLLLEFLREGLGTLKHQQTTLFRNNTWLKKQSASEMAVLHGVIADKCVRLLEAMSGDRPESLT